MSGPCAKRRVFCSIETKDGFMRFWGSNDCENPQEVCPRAPGEGYEKCKTICQQAGHAEIVALECARQFDVDLRGSTAYVHNHTHCCRQCQEALYDAGVQFISVRKPL